MSWNYRVIHQIHENGEHQFAIHEVYYNDNDGTTIKSWTANPVYPAGETIEELSGDISHYRRALIQPTLELAELEAMYPETSKSDHSKNDKNWAIIEQIRSLTIEDFERPEIIAATDHRKDYLNMMRYGMRIVLAGILFIIHEGEK